MKEICSDDNYMSSDRDLISDRDLMIRFDANKKDILQIFKSKINVQHHHLIIHMLFRKSEKK